MATIFPLRSPRYEILTTPSGAVSAKLELTIDSTLRYTIIKECTAGATVTFEIAELCRDYIEPTLWTVANVVYSNLSGIAISRAITFWPILLIICILGIGPDARPPDPPRTLPDSLYTE